MIEESGAIDSYDVPTFATVFLGKRIARRGMPVPTAEPQIALAVDGFRFAALDRLMKDGHAQPSIADLIRTSRRRTVLQPARASVARIAGART